MVLRSEIKNMKVSFAKYDKKGVPWNDPVMKGERTSSKTVGNEGKSLAHTLNGRSFKDVVKGLQYSMKEREVESKDSGSLADHGIKKNIGRPHKMSLKGLCWRLLEGIFSSNNIKEVRRRLDGVIDQVISNIHWEEKIMNCSDGYREEEELQRIESKEEMPGAFWEEEIISSM